MGTWLQQGEHALYVDMLQAERKRETGFLTNSYFTMDLELLKETMEEDIGCKVGLRWKPIAGTFNKDGVPVRAIHIEVDSSYYHQALRKLSNVYGKGVSGFRDGRKMRFFASLRNAKSAETKASVKKAIERQRFFNDVVKRDYLSDILHLDVIPSGSNLPTMREMINRIKSIQFPHLRMIHSIDETWGKVLYKGDFTYLVMPHIEEEAYLMMSNLLPFLRYEYGENVLLYFTFTAKELAMEDVWDPVQKRVICTVDTNAEMEDDDDELGFDEARKFVEAKQKATGTKTNTPTNRPDLQDSTPTNLELQQAAAAKINALTNAAEAAYYKDDDSISTLGSLGTAITQATRTQCSTNAQSQVTNPSTLATGNDEVHHIINETNSVASSITMESFQNLQFQVTQQDAKLNHIDLILGKMAEVVLKGDKASQPQSTNGDDEAGGTASSSGSGL